jgi:hypothetical protein
VPQDRLNAYVTTGAVTCVPARFVLCPIGDATLTSGNGPIASRGLACALRLLACAVRVLEVRSDLLGDLGVAFMGGGGAIVGLGGSLGCLGGSLAGASNPTCDLVIHRGPPPPGPRRARGMRKR